MSKKVAQVIVETLQSAGVRNCYGIVAEWLGQPGPALLNVKVEPMELVMPPHTALENVYGMAMYSLKAVMHGQAGDVFEMIGENT
jgi:pyruvate dehydrogenase (quinone)